jgi:3-dehydroquinate synthase
VIRVPVPLGDRTYEVVVGSGVLGDPSLVPAGSAARGFVVSDRTVAAAWLAPLAGGLRAAGVDPVHLPVPEGERAKSLDTAEALYHELAGREARRDDLVVALGGGVVGDLAGFVAATYLRGMRVVQVPTTLLAQVDAAVGGKTAVNLPEGKNLVGAYHQPAAVIADVDTLSTLPDREFRSGLAEVAKYALAVDPGLLDTLEGRRDALLAREPAILEDVIARCVRAKAATVALDERDAGPRLVLNYGHTVGHALERLDDFAGRTHGEAVARGMVVAARLAEGMGVAPSGLVAGHVRLLASLGLPTGGPFPPAERVLAAIGMDKKRQLGHRFVLLEEIGRPRVVEDVPEGAIRAALEGS